MKYMGDYPSKKMRLGTDLTDQVFEHALVHVRFIPHPLKNNSSGIASCPGPIFMGKGGMETPRGRGEEQEDRLCRKPLKGLKRLIIN